jgi:hypothetical protein
MEVKYKRLLVDSGIATSIGVIITSIGTILGMDRIWVIGAITISMGIVGILITSFWAFLEYIYCRE